MNTFMVLVERAVRPVQAGPKQKLRMREELLAHLMAIYADELVHRGDDSAARAEAVRRFGDPTALAAELQASVTLRDRIDAHLDRAFGWRPGESAAWYSARLAGLVALVFVGLFLLWACAGVAANPALAPSVPVVLRWWAAILVLGPGTVFLMSLLYIRIRDSLHGAFGSPRSWRHAVGYAALSSLVMLATGVTLTLLMVLDMGKAANQLTSTRSLVFSAAAWVFMPLFMVAYARKAGPGEIRHVEWSSLDVGQ